MHIYDKHTIVKHSLLTFLLLLVIVPMFTFAAPPFVPCDGANVPSKGLTACTECHFVQMANIILNWLIGFLFVVFAVVLTIGGFGLVTSGGNPQAKTDAKNKLVNAIIGLIIVMGAWLLVDTIMRGLLTGDDGVITGFGPWSRIECGVQYLSRLVPVVSSGGVSPSGTGLTETEALAALGAENITVVSSGGCTDPTIRTCTGVAGLQQSTIDNVIAMDQACSDCNIVVTAGTEVGHTNSCHQAGTCVDIDCRPANGSAQCSVEQINTIKAAAESKGLTNTVYEVSTAARKAELVDAGVDSDTIAVVNWINGEHFSLYPN